MDYLQTGHHPSSQIMLFKVPGLNPVELLSGLEMFEDDLKAGKSNCMNRIDIPQKVYNSEWKGVHVIGKEFSRLVCSEMGIHGRMDLMKVMPI